MKTEEFFIDGVGKLSYNGGIFRLEFTTLEAIPEPGLPARYVTSHRVVMSLDTLLKVQGSLQRAAQELKDKGISK